MSLLRRKRFWFGLAVTLGFLAFFLVRTDFEQIGDSFAGAEYGLAVASIPLYFVGFWLRSVRWRLLLRPVGEVPAVRLYPIVLIGLTANNLIPARAGDVARAYIVGEREGISKSAALGSVVVDRVFDGLTLVAVLGIVAAFSGVDPGVTGLGVLTAVLFFGAAAALLALAFSPERARGLVLRLVSLLPRRPRDLATGLVDSFLAGIQAVRSAWVLATSAALSLASWLTETTMYWLVGEAFDLGVGFHVYLLIAAGANLALTVLPSPGGVGPFEAATVAILSFFDVPHDPALAYGVALHALLLGPVTGVGLALLWTTGLTFGELMGIRREETDEPVPAAPGPEPKPE